LRDGVPVLSLLAVVTDPHAVLRDEVLRPVLEGDAVTDPALRAAAANGIGLPEDLQPLIAKVHAHAYKVTDDDVARLRRTYDDDRLFELIVSASLGASRKRLLAGLKALNEACD
jgi:hypothetical protein